MGFNIFTDTFGLKSAPGKQSGMPLPVFFVFSEFGNDDIPIVCYNRSVVNKQIISEAAKTDGIVFGLL